MMKHLISAQELSSRLEQKRGTLSILDASWYLPNQNRDAKAEFEASRIPGAQFFDIDALSDLESSLPHMMPNASDFAKKMGGLGASHLDEFVVYDGPGLFSAARCWFMLKAFGVENVRVLEGGFDRWQQNGFEVETGPASKREKKTFHASLDETRLVNAEDVLEASRNKTAAILDARATPRFTGEVAEPRPGLRSGHIPGSKTLPFDELQKDGTLLDKPALRKRLEACGVDLDQPIITTCGSGVTAAVITLALETLEIPSRLYDGSWAEWGAQNDLPVETGD